MIFLTYWNATVVDVFKFDFLRDIFYQSKTPNFSTEVCMFVVSTISQSSQEFLFWSEYLIV